jgi:hypothetical protein
MTLNLAYRIKKIFQGESGIVERIEPQNPMDKTNYFKDSHGDLPKRIFIRTPLGELVTLTSPMVLERRESFKGRLPLDYQVYKQYQPGDKFP